MNAAEFIAAVKHARKAGAKEMRARLSAPFRGVVNVAIRNLDGSKNGNPNDLWIESVSGLQTKGRAYIGSRNMPVNLDGWAERIESIRQI